MTPDGISFMTKTTDRFWNKVDIGSREECWRWKASVQRGGYGALRLDGKLVRAHRYSFFLHYGYYPPVVMHACDNPPCVNPSHLLAGTITLNLADMVAKGRHNNGYACRTRCPQGHLYDEANTYIDKTGSRHCRICMSERYTKVGYKNSMKTHCAKGHPFDEENTHIRKSGSRYCRACNKERSRIHRTKKGTI